MNPLATAPSDPQVGAMHEAAARIASGDVLRRLRRSQNLTQAELADALYITQERVSALERRGVGHATIGTLRRYVEALGGRLLIVVDLDGDRFDLG